MEACLKGIFLVEMLDPRAMYNFHPFDDLI